MVESASLFSKFTNEFFARVVCLRLPRAVPRADSRNGPSLPRSPCSPNSRSTRSVPKIAFSRADANKARLMSSEIVSRSNVRPRLCFTSLRKATRRITFARRLTCFRVTCISRFREERNRRQKASAVVPPAIYAREERATIRLKASKLIGRFYSGGPFSSAIDRFAQASSLIFPRSRGKIRRLGARPRAYNRLRSPRTTPTRRFAGGGPRRGITARAGKGKSDAVIESAVFAHGARERVRSSGNRGSGAVLAIGGRAVRRSGRRERNTAAEDSRETA